MKRNKVVVYTAIAGGVDDLIQHHYRSVDFDYVCFTDTPVAEPGMWDVRLMNRNHLDEVRKAKYFKIFPHEFFPEYQYSVWMDGSIDVLGDALERRVGELIEQDALIAANRHPDRACVYEEANACISLGKDDPGVIFRQVEFMRASGFPENMGLFEMGIIYRKHHNVEVIQLMNDWWWMVKTFSRRDQLSFMYVLSKNDMKCAQLFKEDIRRNSAFSLNAHSKIFYAVLMLDTGAGFDYKNMRVQRAVAKDGEVVELLFDLANISAIKRMRLIPFDTGMGMVKLMSAVVQERDGGLVNLDLQKVTFNGRLQEDGFVLFQTFSPTFDFSVEGQVDQIIISGVFMLKSRMASQGIISRELESIYASSAWMVGNLVLWLPRKLYALFTRMISSGRRR